MQKLLILIALTLTLIPLCARANQADQVEYPPGPFFNFGLSFGLPGKWGLKASLYNQYIGLQTEVARAPDRADAKNTLVFSRTDLRLSYKSPVYAFGGYNKDVA